MLLEGTVRDGVIVPDDARQLSEGARVRIEEIAPKAASQPIKSFDERFGMFMVDDARAPTDLAAQHEHYRLGAPRR